MYGVRKKNILWLQWKEPEKNMQNISNTSRVKSTRCNLEKQTTERRTAPRTLPELEVLPVDRKKTKRPKHFWRSLNEPNSHEKTVVRQKKNMTEITRSHWTSEWVRRGYSYTQSSPMEHIQQKFCFVLNVTCIYYPRLSWWCTKKDATACLCQNIRMWQMLYHFTNKISTEELQKLLQWRSNHKSGKVCLKCETQRLSGTSLHILTCQLWIQF